MFKGRIFPTPDQCLQLYNLLTLGEGPMTGDDFIRWLYYNLGSSSFFNDLFSAASEFLLPNPQARSCGLCTQLPCVALNPTFIPSWITLMRAWPAGKKAEALRYQAYKNCHAKIGFSRVPIPDCHLLAIRCCLPGGPIVGFRPRYIKKMQEAQPVVEIPGQNQEEEGDFFDEAATDQLDDDDLQAQQQSEEEQQESEEEEEEEEEEVPLRITRGSRAN
jgi:hypothetical protein